MKLLPVYLFSLASIFFTGCVQYKEYPFPYDKNSTIDKRLSGTWKINIQKTDFKKLFGEDKPQDDTENIVITFIANKTNTIYSMDTGSLPLYNAYTSTLKEHNYLNFTPDTSPNEYNHLKYTINGDELVLYMQNGNVLTEDIKNKKLWGIVSKNGILPIVEIYIIQQPESYKQYLLENDKRLYNLPLYLTRGKENTSKQTPTSSK